MPPSASQPMASTRLCIAGERRSVALPSTDEPSTAALACGEAFSCSSGAGCVRGRLRGRASPGLGWMRLLPLASPAPRGSEVHSLWVVGVCVYAGFETKLAKNMREAPIKFSQLDRIANSAVIVILCFQFALSLASAVGMSGFEKANDKDLWYTGLKSSISHSGVDAKWADLEPRDRQDLGFGFLTFVIMYCFFVPMSLYVTFDLVRHPCPIFTPYSPVNFRAGQDLPDEVHRLGRGDGPPRGRGAGPRQS